MPAALTRRLSLRMRSATGRRPAEDLLAVLELEIGNQVEYEENGRRRVRDKPVPLALRAHGATFPWQSGTGLAVSLALLLRARCPNGRRDVLFLLGRR